MTPHFFATPFACTVVLFLTACHADASQPETSRPALVYPVQVAPVSAQKVEYALTAVGSVEAYERISMMARVPGVVERVLFTEGDHIERGQVLVEIELQRYVLGVKAAEAALARAQAALAEAQAGVVRRETALRQTPGLIPGEELESWRTRVQTLTAERHQAEVALEQAQLNLHDARVRAPADGVVQTRDVQTGQYVQAGTPLASLVRREPLLLRFAVPEGDALRLQTGMLARFHLRDDSKTFTAALIHVAAAAEASTRMVLVTAKIRDSQRKVLRPGAFAEVIIPIAADGQMPVIPQTAVRASERGFVCYVVDSEHARERRVTLGLRTPEGLVEVREGLVPGEVLIIRGVEALREGAAVRVVTDQEVPKLGNAEPVAQMTSRS